MDEKETVEKAVKRGSRAGTRRRRYTFEEKLRAVKLHLEEGFKAELVSTETGVSTSSLGVWLRDYRREGEMGLRRESSPRPGRRQPRVGGGGVFAPRRGATTPASGGGEDPGDEAGKPVLRGEEDCGRPAALVLPGGERGDGEENPPRGRPDGRAPQGTSQPCAPALLRAGDAEPDVADGHLHVPLGRQVRLRGGVHGRLLALRR
jgi:transposase-like protein